MFQHERQKEKVKVEELLEEIDVQWKSIQSLMPKAVSDKLLWCLLLLLQFCCCYCYYQNTKDKSNSTTNDIDDFDRYLKELEAQPRAAMVREIDRIIIIVSDG